MKYYSKHVIIIIIKTREPYQNPEISNLIKTLDLVFLCLAFLCFGVLVLCDWVFGAGILIKTLYLIKTLNSSQKTDS